MNNPGERSDQTPQQGGRGSNPRNTRSRNTGEGLSGGGDSVAGQAAESSRPTAAGIGLFGQTIVQGSGTRAAGSGGGTSSSAFSSGAGGTSGGGGVGAAVLQIGDDRGGVAQRKRTREGDAGAGPSRTVQDDSPPPPPPPPPVDGPPFLCTICPREFRTDRGLCGHMRSHADRPWRGAFPPPVFSREEFYEAGVGHLLNPPLEAEDAGHRAVEGGALAGQGDATSEMSGRQRDATAAEAEASGGEKQKLPDLNETPPRDEHGDYI